MASAYRVRRVGEDTDLFLKRVRIDGSNQGNALQRETDVYHRLQGSSSELVLRIVDIVHDDDDYAIVTEWADGGTLKDLVARQPAKRLSPSEVKRVAIQVFECICALHDQGIVHRDVKPENVLLVRGRWKLADFGIAKNLTRIVEHNTFQRFGTSGYAPPEQLDGVQADPSADVYAFGKLLVYMLTGQTDSDKMRFPMWVALIRGCTREDSKRRFSTSVISEMLQALPYS